MAAKDKLNRQSSSSGPQQMGVTMTPPNIRMGSPKISIPEIKVPAVNIPAADMAPVAKAIEQLGKSIAEVANAQTEILKVMHEHHQMLGQIVSQMKPPEVQVDVAAPTVRMAPRPREFDIAFVEDTDGIVGMKIRANSPN